MPAEVEKIVTLVVLAVTLLALIREWLPVGLVAIAAPLSLVLCGILEPQEMWDGLAHPAVVAVGGMFVLSQAVSRTGALGFLGASLSSMGIKGNRRILAFMILSAGILSAFVNNTTVVLVGLPIVLAMCERLDHPPSRYLIPLSFGSIFGGMLTLIGTSTNVIIAESGRTTVEAIYGDRRFDPGMWDFAPMGAVFLVVGTLYLVLFGRRFLPDRVALSMSLGSGMPSEYVTEAEILPGSPLAGRPLEEVSHRHQGLRILQLIRKDVIQVPDPKVTFEVGDVMLVKGGASQIMDLHDITGTAIMPELGEEGVKTRQVDVTLAEVIVPPASRWIGKEVRDIGFRARYGVSVIAVQRQGHHIRQKVGELEVEPADMLLVQGTVESLRNLRSSDNLILVEGVAGQVKTRRRAPIALAGLVFFVGLVSFGLADIATAAMVSAVLVVISRCLTLQEAFDGVDWNVLFMLAGALGLGKALANVGLANDAANSIIEVFGESAPWILVGVIFLFTSILTDFLSNQAAAALMIPIVVQASHDLGFDPRTLLFTVAFAASSAFVTPMGYQTNLIVYGPGGYRFRDFMVVGLPLRFVFWLLAAALIPVFYPPT